MSNEPTNEHANITALPTRERLAGRDGASHQDHGVLGDATDTADGDGGNAERAQDIETFEDALALAGAYGFTPTYHELRNAVGLIRAGARRQRDPLPRDEGDE